MQYKATRSLTNSQGTANTIERVYNASGRVVAERTNDESWACTTYDARGRITTKSFPAIGTRPARTVTYNYAVGGDPLTKRVIDSSGAITTTIDLLNRTTSYTDANAVTTATSYDRAGRVTTSHTTVQGVTSMLTQYWDKANKPTRLDLDGVTIATTTYNADVLAAVAYGNGADLAISHNDTGRVKALDWTTAGSTVTSAVTRSREQRIINETITDTATPGTEYEYGYTYDSIGRLVAADVPFHQLAYEFSASNECGNPYAGLNSNRTAFADSYNGAPAVVTRYCYDAADRLLSTTGATALTVAYDTYGNTTQIGTDTLEYDSTRRHVATTTASGGAVTYTRDIDNRVMARSTQINSDPAQVTRYGFTSDEPGPDFVLDAAGSLRQRIVKLPGGAVLTKTYGAQGAAAANWSYPNVHGDILFTTDGSGTRTGTIHLYDPYGQNIDPATGAFGDIPIPSTAEGGMDFGWLGQHTVPVEHIASLQALEMGARTYLPILGRFLQTDPVLHGSANDYDYVNGDPVNFLDLSGEAPKGGKDGIDPPGSGKNRGFPKLEGFDYYDIYGNLQPYPVPGKNSEPARINPIEALAAGWPTPTRGGCQEAAAEIQGIIGGTIYHVTSAGAGTQSLGPSSHIFNRDGEWNHHYVVIIEDANGVPIVYDAFTGPEGLPMDAYRAQWKDGYGEYLQFKSVG